MSQPGNNDPQELPCDEQLHRARMEIERLTILLGWEAGELSEGQAARLLGLDRLALRRKRQDVLERAASYLPVPEPQTPFDQWKADHGW